MTELVTGRLGLMVRVIGNAARGVGGGVGGEGKVVEKVIVNPHAWWWRRRRRWRAFPMLRSFLSSPLLLSHLLFCSNFHR